MVIGATAVCKWTEKGRRGEVGRGKEGLGRKKVNKGSRKGKELSDGEQNRKVRRKEGKKKEARMGEGRRSSKEKRRKEGKRKG